MTVSVVDRLMDAINSHDIEALTACFAPTFSMVWPAHPARSFSGPDQVRRNWTTLFQAYPDMRAEASRRVHRDKETWAEWEFAGKSTDGAQFWQRGVIIVMEECDLIVESRFYMEPVDPAAGS
jgi:ketosteroid isomerase-like protein